MTRETPATPSRDKGWRFLLIVLLPLFVLGFVIFGLASLPVSVLLAIVVVLLLLR